MGKYLDTLEGLKSTIAQVRKSGVSGVEVESMSGFSLYTRGEGMQNTQPAPDYHKFAITKNKAIDDAYDFTVSFKRYDQSDYGQPLVFENVEHNFDERISESILTNDNMKYLVDHWDSIAQDFDYRISSKAMTQSTTMSAYERLKMMDSALDRKYNSASEKDNTQQDWGNNTICY